MLDFFDRLYQFTDRFFPRPYRIIGYIDNEFLYREGERKVYLIYELTPSDPRGDMMIDATTLIRWTPPHDDELIPEEKRQQILQRLGEKLKKEKTNYWINTNTELEERERQAAMRRKAEKQRER